MFFLKENYTKHIYLIVFILIQVIGYKTVQGFQCIQCGANGSDCKDDLSDKPSDCPAGEQFSKCFTRIDDKFKIIRGCLSSTDAGTCTPDKKCISTDESKNNQLICKTCSATDADCSQTDASAGGYSEICDAGVDKCIKKINDKFVVRGCASQTEACTDANASTCETCTSVNCNTGIFPKDRLTCYQCSGDKCNDVTGITSKACLLFEDKDECYTKGENDKSMTRGCKSDPKDNPCPATDDGCAFCPDKGCNNLKYKGQPTLKCYQCTGDSADVACFKNQTGTATKNCLQEILYNQKQYCYTQIVNEKIQRGCLNDNVALSADKCNDALGGACNKCSGDGCNGDNAELTCLKCRSDENTNCANDPSKILGANCSSVGPGCYQGVWNGVTIRDCTAAASLQDQALCMKKDNPNRCEICHTKDCNNKKSSGTKNALSLALVLVILMSLWSFK